MTTTQTQTEIRHRDTNAIICISGEDTVRAALEQIIAGGADLRYASLVDADGEEEVR